MSTAGRPVHRIIYSSKVSQPALGKLETALPGILQVAQARNRAVGVTGILLTCNGHFVQCLEGPIRPVLETLGRIKADPRHQEFHLIEAGPAKARCFGDWGMCGVPLSPVDSEIVMFLEAGGQFDPTRLGPERAMQLLTSVAEMQRKRQPTLG